ncbi:hypothetical protein [Parathermosynechococcus lividus]
MQILEHTDYSLRLRDRPRLLWFLGGLFLLASGAIPVAFGHHELLCQRQTEPLTCVLTNTYALHQQRLNIPIANLRRAHLNRDTDSDGDTTYRVELLTGSRTIPFGSFSSDRGDRQRTVERINQFLENPSQPQLHLTQDERWIGWLILAITLPIGGGLVLLPAVVDVEMDRTSGTWTLRRRNLWGHQTQEYRLRDITDVFLEVSHSSDSDSTYRIVFQLKSGETIPLRHYYSSGRRDKQQTVDCLREFLCLPSALEDDAL